MNIKLWNGSDILLNETLEESLNFKNQYWNEFKWPSLVLQAVPIKQRYAYSLLLEAVITGNVTVDQY